MTPEERKEYNKSHKILRSEQMKEYRKNNILAITTQKKKNYEENKTSILHKQEQYRRRWNHNGHSF